MSPVSRNAGGGGTSTLHPHRSDIPPWGVVLRAVAVSIKAGEMLYLAADLLKPGRNQIDRAYNRGIEDMVAVLLGLPEVNPETVQYVLRHLPESE